MESEGMESEAGGRRGMRIPDGGGTGEERLPEEKEMHE